MAVPERAVARPAWMVIAEDVASLPAGATLAQRVAPLLHNLTLAAGAGSATLWLPEDPSDACPSPPAGRGRPAGVAVMTDRPGVRAVVPVRDGNRDAGALVIVDGPAGPAATVPAALLAQTADCVALLLREAHAQAACRDERGRAQGMADQAARNEADLAAVLDAERQRLATWVLTGTTRRLDEVTWRWRDFAAVARDDPPGAPAALHALRTAVDGLIEGFRTVVRAVHPSTLRSRGAALALGELAARLPRRSHCTGDLGRRVGWEVESGIYHATAAVLAALPATGDAELLVHFSRTAGRLAVRVSDPAGSVERLRAALVVDARLLSALGGGLRCHLSMADAAVVDVWLPESLAGTDDPGPGAA
ncbi:hypothetical protein [Frankia tisae]|uniref:hypothetical protein n=1 Tax=Frankia tisae TaxID=2950104 RepID=UPI0021C14D72|nr:hypothetical protein [Frankia tisae]